MIMAANPVPAHVPPALVRDYDWTDMKGETDAFAHIRKLHEGPDVFYTPRHGGHWVVTRFDDMVRVLSSAEEFSSRHQSVPVNPMVLPLIEYDGAMHKDFRNVLAPFFTPKSIGNLEQVSRSLTRSLMDGFYSRGECEFIGDFAQRMPIMILMNLLALPPEDTQYLLPLSEQIVRSGNQEKQAAAFQRVGEYITNKVLPARRARMGSDVFSALIKARLADGRAMTDEEIVGLGILLIAAGLDTVASMLGFITRFLAENPAHRRQLVENPAMINDALEEMLRRFTISNVARVVIADMEFKGVTFKAGDIVFTPLSAADIDERRFRDPLTVDFKRGDKKTLVFGRGPHQCIGAFLARTELRVFLQEWLKRIPDFHVREGVVPVSVVGKADAIRFLPLVWQISP
jgi:cytochrome P450